MSDDVGDKASRPFAGAIFCTIAVLIALDLVADRGEGSGLGHLLLELAVLAAALSGAFAMWRRYELARADLVRAREDARRWKATNEGLLRGLGAAVADQCREWGLTTAESEVALMLLKGLSLKEIAGTRGTSERTVREQARAVYRKAGLSGRVELSAFFLEDLLLPSSDSDR